MLVVIGSIVELKNGEYREVIGLQDNMLLLDDDTMVRSEVVKRVLSDEEIADLVADRMSDI